MKSNKQKVSSESIAAQYSIEDLKYLMSRLRDPEDGCPWDLKQNYKSITPSTLEEAYEVVDAIEREDYLHLKEELGDLLFQVVFYSQLGAEEERFTFDNVVDALTTKLIRRHPHVFPNGTLDSRIDKDQPDENAVKASWEAIKKSEREQKGNVGVLDDVPKALPALSRAAKLQKRASKVGFDWPEIDGVFAKFKEELSELSEAISAGEAGHIEEEMGDLFFMCVNLSRHLSVEPEKALRVANQKFEARFSYIEHALQEKGTSLECASLEEMDGLWEEAKSRS